MPTRRVALGDRVLPTAHPGYGPILLGCIAATTVAGLDEEQTEALGRFLREARTGLAVPRRAPRLRPPTGTQGPAHSPPPPLGEGSGPVTQLDVHRHHPVPQLPGAAMAG